MPISEKYSKFSIELLEGDDSQLTNSFITKVFLFVRYSILSLSSSGGRRARNCLMIGCGALFCDGVGVLVFVEPGADEDK